MILQGNQRGGAKNLALHLLKDENDHVDVHELRGFVSNDLVNALNEAHFISKATKAKQFLFSLSLNPPSNENVPTKAFEEAIEKAEKKLGLTNQPRAIVFHEKNNRRHAHVVWSRIHNDGQKLKAIPLPYTKLKLMDIARELYIQHGWQMPKGMMNPHECNPKNFTHQQWQQSKRIGKDPRAIKQVFQECWAVSDDKDSFASALQSRGYILAKGDRRGFVAVDHRCEIFAVAKWSGVKTKDVKEKLGDTKKLPCVADVKKQVAKEMSQRLTQIKNDQQTTINIRLELLKSHKQTMLKRHKQQRQDIKERHENRMMEEANNRQQRFNKGLRGIFDLITGNHTRIRKQNELEALQSFERDKKEKDMLIFKQMKQSQSLQKRVNRLQDFQQSKEQSVSSDMKQYLDIENNKRELFELRKSKLNDLRLSSLTLEK